jgi:hypothetical protein
MPNLSICVMQGEAMRYEPLSRFPALRTHDVDELRQRLSGLFSVWSMDLGRGGQRTFKGCLNHRQMQDVGVTYARYGAPLAVCLSHGDTYLHFPFAVSAPLSMTEPRGKYRLAMEPPVDPTQICGSNTHPILST